MEDFWRIIFSIEKLEIDVSTNIVISPVLFYFSNC